MGSYLGVFIGDKIVKYAKLSKEDGSGKIKAISYGTKINLGNTDDIINSIVSATGSQDVPICVNTENEKVHEVEVLKIIGKSDLENLIELEVLDVTGTDTPQLGAEDKVNRNCEYRYTLLESAKSRENYTANIIIQDRNTLEKYVKDEQSKVTSMYMVPYILDEIIPKNEPNCLIINMNQKTELSFVTSGKLSKVVTLDIGMEKIFSELPELVGSFQKAYDICKTINIFSDDGTNNPEYERIIEPVLQDALSRIQTKITELKLRVDKIYLAGEITLFINSDLLFEQYFDVPAEKIKPYFIDPSDSNNNMSEITETAEAFALAYEGMTSEREGLNFFRSAKKSSIFQFGKNKDINKNNGAKEIGKKEKALNTKKFHIDANNINILGLNLSKIQSILIYSNVLACVVIVMYLIFTVVYSNQLNNQIEKANTEVANITANTSSVQSDTNYINSNTSKYTKYTSYVDEILRKINSGEIGQYSAYNIATFMYKIAKFIPTDANMRINSIYSDNNKHVTINVSADTYVPLGYFIAQLRLQGILESSSVTVTNVADGITVEIGGDLP